MVLNAIGEFVGLLIFGDKKPTKRQKIAGWVVMLAFVGFLFWLTVTYS